MTVDGWNEFERGARSLHFMRAGLERPQRPYSAPRAFRALVTAEVRKDVEAARHERPWLDGLPFWPFGFTRAMAERT